MVIFLFLSFSFLLLESFKVFFRLLSYLSPLFSFIHFLPKNLTINRSFCIFFLLQNDNSISFNNKSHFSIGPWRGGNLVVLIVSNNKRSFSFSHFWQQFREESGPHYSFI
jgi:hypothetical protein